MEEEDNKLDEDPSDLEYQQWFSYKFDSSTNKIRFKYVNK